MANEINSQSTLVIGDAGTLVMDALPERTQRCIRSVWVTAKTGTPSVCFLQWDVGGTLEDAATIPLTNGSGVLPPGIINVVEAGTEIYARIDATTEAIVSLHWLDESAEQ